MSSGSKLYEPSKHLPAYSKNSKEWTFNNKKQSKIENILAGRDHNIS